MTSDATGATVLAQWYDSTRQRQLLQSEQGSLVRPSALTVRTAVGHLRWDALRFAGRVQPATQILDGALFHHLAGNDVFEKVGVPSGDALVLPITVLTPGPDLASALVQMVSRGFYFSSLNMGRDVRERLQDELDRESARERVERVCAEEGTSEGVARLLAETSMVPAAEVERLARAWRFWLEAERRGLIRCREARPYGDDTASFEVEAFDTLPLRTAPGREARGRIMSEATLDDGGVRRRSLVWDVLSELHIAGSDDERADAAVLREAFDRVYYRRIAQAEGVAPSTRSDEVLHGRRRRASLLHRTDDRTVWLPDRFLDRLGALSPEQWQQLYEGVLKETSLTAWWSARDLRGLQETADFIAAHTPDPPATRRSVTRTAAWTVTEMTPPMISAGLGGLAANPLVGLGLGAGVWILEKGLERWKTARSASYDVVEVYDTGPDHRAR